MRNGFVVILFVMIIALLAACSESDDTASQKQKNQETPVETVQAKTGDFVVEKTVYGRMEPLSMTPVTLPVPGEVDDIEVVEGDHVSKNDTLFTLKTAAGKQTIKAPKDGKVLQLKAEKGATISNENPAAMIADGDKMKMELSVTSALRKHFKQDDTYDVQFNSKKYKAVVTYIGAMPEENGLYTVKAEVDNKKDVFIAGDIAALMLPVKAVKDTVILPTAAIVEKDNQSYVYLVKDGEAREEKVEITEMQSDESAVEGNVKKGDQVVVNGQQTLSNHSKVNATERQE